MVAKRGKSIPTEYDQNIEQAHQKYSFLKQEVVQWQQERGAHWLNMISLADKPPYLPIQNLPLEAIIELWQRLNGFAKVEISNSRLKEIWQGFCDDQSLPDSNGEQMSTHLQMAVRGVAQLAGKMANDKGLVPVNSADYSCNTLVCPVCGETTSLAIVTPPDGKRIMHCNSCDFEWAVKRLICLNCGSEEAKKQVYLKNEAFPGVEMVVCQACGQYYKEIDLRELPVKDYMWEDLRTLPLNFAAEHWLSEYTAKNSVPVNDNQVH